MSVSTAEEEEEGEGGMNRSVPLHLPRRQVTQIGKNVFSVSYTTWSRRKVEQEGREENESHDSPKERRQLKEK